MTDLEAAANKFKEWQSKFSNIFRSLEENLVTKKMII